MAKLKSVAFENYKAFADDQTLEIRPITLLFGHNSVGKSAALRLLPILARAVRPRSEASYSPTVLDYSAPALRGAGLADIANRSSKAQAVSFALQWDAGRFALTLRQTGASNPTGRHELVSAFEMTIGQDRLEATLLDPDANTYELSDGNAATIPFNGLCPNLPEPLASRFAPLLKALGGLGESVQWLTAVRAQPPRQFTLEPGGSAEVGPDGSGTAAALWISALREDGVANAVSAWLKAACGCELTFAATDAQVALGKQWFPFQIRTGGADVAVADVGEGVAQALPVVTLCRQAAAGLLGDYPVLALEQPELHLHPKAAASLAEEIVACVADGSSAAHVIETHSEHFLLALQVALLEGRLTRDQLLVYWVANDAGSAQLRRIEFDDEGFPSDGWPDGVFREALEQARRIGELRVSQ
ncbi:MAG: hypothetical protein EON90_12335 [Brevundimonas sp.]|nr:MAG: hypothetical protein EON90_12335 [Brevundimonas sp.]